MALKKPGRHDFVAKRGDTWRQPLEFGGAFPVADMTGWTGRMDLRNPDDRTELYATLTTENGGISIDGPNLIVELLLTDVQTGAFDWDQADYDLELIDTPGTGDRVTWLEGLFCCSDEVTQ